MAEGTEKRIVGTGVVKMINMLNNIDAWMSVNVAGLISLVISLIAFYFSISRFFWDSEDRTLKFIKSIRWWKFGKEDIDKILFNNSKLSELHKENKNNYVAININNNTGVTIDMCMLLFKPADKRSWRKYCKQLVEDGFADYIIFCRQLSPMQNHINRYVLKSVDIDKMDVAICVRDMRGTIWLKSTDDNLIKLNKKIYRSLISLEDNYSDDVIVSEIVAHAMNDDGSRLLEVDSNYKILL